MDNLSPVEETAVQVSFARWKGSNDLLRADGTPYFDGSFDKRLVDATVPIAKQTAYTDRPDAHLACIITVRTAEIDNQLRLVCQELAHPQVVILGAGLDARCWRLSLPQDTTVFEVDSGVAEALKLSVWHDTQPTCIRIFVKADLGAQGELAARLLSAGFRPGIPTVWVLEGLIGYLSREAGTALLADVYAISGPGSRLIMTAPPTEEWRDTLLERGIVLHHNTFEPASATLQRLLSTGWRGSILPSTTLAATYNAPGYSQDFILGYKE